jgi:pullulanase/glycogen debranching enzyme
LRGSYAGWATVHPSAHLKALGVTAVSLLPVHYSLSEERLVKHGAEQLLGLQHPGLFLRQPPAGSGAWRPVARDEFRAMVKALHAAGIEVIAGRGFQPHGRVRRGRSYDEFSRA